MRTATAANNSAFVAVRVGLALTNSPNRPFYVVTASERALKITMSTSADLGRPLAWWVWGGDFFNAPRVAPNCSWPPTDWFLTLAFWSAALYRFFQVAQSFLSLLRPSKLLSAQGKCSVEIMVLVTMRRRVEAVMIFPARLDLFGHFQAHWCNRGFLPCPDGSAEFYFAVLTYQGHGGHCIFVQVFQEFRWQNGGVEGDGVAKSTDSCLVSANSCRSAILALSTDFSLVRSTLVALSGVFLL